MKIPPSWTAASGPSSQQGAVKRHRRAGGKVPVPLWVAWVTLLGLGACEPAPSDPPQPAKVPVTTEVLEPGPFQARVTVLGRVIPSATVELRTANRGQIVYPPRFAQGLRTGEPVRAGELLYELENEDVRLRFTEARLQARAAEAELERARLGVEAGFFSMAELRRREIETELALERQANAELQSRRLRTEAPLDGYLVVDHKFPPGAELATQTRVAVVAGDGTPRVEGWAAASDLDRLRPGLEVLCRAPGSDPNDPLVASGELRELARQVDESGTVRLIVDITEALDLPPPGQGLELLVLLEEKPDALTVPEASLVLSGGAASVFVLEAIGEDFRVERRFVETGAGGDGRIEIVGGLRPGERVAVRGVEFLTDGATAVDATPKAKPAGGKSLEGLRGQGLKNGAGKG